MWGIEIKIRNKDDRLSVVEAKKNDFYADNGGVWLGVCLGQRCGYHGCGPRRVGVYAAQHATGRECVSRGSTAGRHVPASRDGKNQSRCMFFSAVVTCSSGWVASQLQALRILIFQTKQSERQAYTWLHRQFSFSNFNSNCTIFGPINRLAWMMHSSAACKKASFFRHEPQMLLDDKKHDVHQ